MDDSRRAICVRVAEQLAELSSELGFDMMTIDVDVAASTGNEGCELSLRLPRSCWTAASTATGRSTSNRLRADIACKHIW